MPNNSVIDVNFDFPEDSKDLSISGKAKVQNGTFETDITPTDIPEYRGDKEYILKLKYDPSNQDDDKVKKLVGENGEKLSLNHRIENEKNSKDEHEDHEDHEDTGVTDSDLIMINSVFLNIK